MLAMVVTVYTTSTCPWCKKTKAWLESNGVDYEEKNVEDDEDAAEEMIDHSGQRGVPVVVIDDEVIVGFDKDRLEEALA
jgi:glutaredoxin-like YruB-family protein